jgi:hypothetical protein
MREKVTVTLRNRQQIGWRYRVIVCLGKFDWISFTESRGIIAAENENEVKYLVLAGTWACVKDRHLQSQTV